MKKFYLFLFAAFTCFAATSCEDKESVSTEMPYKAQYVIDSQSFIGVGNTVFRVKELYESTLRRLSDLQVKYDESWTVPVSGSSIDEACAAADTDALMKCDEPEKALQELKKFLDETIDETDFGSGSFRIVVHYEVGREDKVLKASESVTLAYPKR